MTVEVADVLDKAADLIDPAKGGRWIRGAIDDGRGGYCMLGALSAGARLRGVRLIGPTYARADETVWSLICDLDGDVRGIGEWNDEHCLDGHEAANVLRKAAEIERGEGGRSAGNSGQYPVLPTTRPPVLMGADGGWTDPRPHPTPTK